MNCRMCAAPLGGAAQCARCGYVLAISSGSEPDTRIHYLMTQTGQALRLSGTGVLGRRPAQLEDGVPRQLVRFDEPSISKSHLEYGHTGSLWIRDLSSTNGTVLVDRCGVHTYCAPGHKFEVAPGDLLRLGQALVTVLGLRAHAA